MSGSRGFTTIDDSGQAQTLEAIAAATLMLGSVVFALQVTTVTPLTASTTSQHIENQQAGIGEGLLDSAVQNGTLKPTLLYWNRSGAIFHDSETGVYTSSGPPTTFGEKLDEHLLKRGLAFDLTIEYATTDGTTARQKVVDMGAPTDHAVTVERTVVLYDDDPLYHANQTASNATLTDSTTFYAPDAAPESRVYNVVQVRLTIWRM